MALHEYADTPARVMLPERDGPPGIHQAFDRHASALDMLENTVENLYDRLATLLRPDRPANAERLLDAVSEDSHVQDRINTGTARVNNVRERLAGLMDRIDI